MTYSAKLSSHIRKYLKLDGYEMRGERYIADGIEAQIIDQVDGQVYLFSLKPLSKLQCRWCEKPLNALIPCGYCQKPMKHVDGESLSHFCFTCLTEEFGKGE